MDIKPPKSRTSKWSSELYCEEDIFCTECLQYKGIVYAIKVKSRHETFYACPKCFERCMKKICYICTDQEFDVSIYRNIKRYPLDLIEQSLEK